MKKIYILAIVLFLRSMLNSSNVGEGCYGYYKDWDLMWRSEIAGTSRWTNGVSPLTVSAISDRPPSVAAISDRHINDETPSVLWRSEIAGTVLGLSAFFFDQRIRDYTQNKIGYSDNFFYDILYGVGDKEYFFYGALAVYSADALLQNSYFHDTLILSTQSLLVTQGLTEAFKKTFRRARPRNSPDNAFDFFRKGDSFFSGHSSGAWSYLTVIAGRFPQIKWLAYGFAGCVSLSRIMEDAHWTSDVIFGAVAGYTIGKLTLQMTPGYTKNILILPYLDEEGGRFVLVQYRI